MKRIIRRIKKLLGIKNVLYIRPNPAMVSNGYEVYLNDKRVPFLKNVEIIEKQGSLTLVVITLVAVSTPYDEIKITKKENITC